ncbi:hypothetical protein FQA39_LY18775 [Lamprigera yunnana]|nr:hypothetical protein FQA39_LY18775 [Lamprigera yunnana]
MQGMIHAMVEYNGRDETSSAQTQLNMMVDERTTLHIIVQDAQHGCSLRYRAELLDVGRPDGRMVGDLNKAQGRVLRKLLCQLEQFKAATKDAPESETPSDDNAIVYQLNYKPEQARFTQTNRLAELEHRLHRLESVLGASNDKLSRLAFMTTKNNLFETAQYLSATASMLDSAQLDHIEGRLTALNQKLDTITEKRSKISEDVEKDKMILELYEILKNSEGFSKILPQTVERLKALEALHNKATEFVKTLTQVENLQTEMQSNIHNNQALLQGVQESFAMNFEEINKNIASLDARIKL